MTQECSKNAPVGWSNVRLGDIIPKARPKIPADPESKLAFVGMDHIEPHTFHLVGQDAFSKMKSAGSYFQPDDVLYGRLRPYLNKVHTAKFEGVASAEFIVLPGAETHDSDFIRFLLHQREFTNFAMSKSSGDRPRVKFDGIADFEFALPPLPEQQRIVEKIETLFARLDKGEEAVREVQKLLTRYRQSVLKSAVTGQLTADWRAEQGTSLSHADDLLDSLLDKRRENWSGRGRYKEPVEPEITELPDLPSEWSWASPDQLSKGEANSLCIGPFGSNLKVDDYRENGVPLVFVRHIRAHDYEGLNPKFVSADKAEELSSHKVFPGDLLVTKMGEPPGDVSIYPSGSPMAVITADCIRFASAGSAIQTRYLEIAISSPLVQRQIKKISKGVAQQKVTLANFKKIALPLPSLEEQARIVDLVDDTISKNEALEKWCETELKRSASLRQSILKDAFAGRLVPQDPSDEPASALLARIKAAKKDHKSRRKARANS